MKENLIKSLNDGNLTIFIGAGVSTLEPSCLPTWWELNHTILDVLAHEANSLTEEVHKVKDYIKDREKNGFLPPEFVAEIITSRIGLSYFDVLKSLEGDEPNPVHYSLAILAEMGKLRWIITTNFDTLIENAFKIVNVPLTVCVDSEDYINLVEDEKLITTSNCVLLKLHGTATRPETCIDTLAQRKQGLHTSITHSLNLLGIETDWLFLGYSGADFEADPNYLGVRSRSLYDRKTFWLQYAGSMLKEAVSHLIDLYKDNGFIDYGVLPDWIVEVLSTNYSSFMAEIATYSSSALGNTREEKLSQLLERTKQWATDQNPFICATILADIGTQAGNYIDSKVIFQTILASYGDELQPLYAGITLQELGSIEYHFANYEQALDYFQRAFEYYKEADERNGYFASIQAIGNILFDNGQFSDAEEVYLQYVDYGRTVDKEILLFSLKVITHFYTLTKEIDKALIYLEEAMKLTEELGDELVRVDLLDSAKQIEELYGNYDEAEKIMLEIISISSRLGDESRLLSGYINLSQLYWTQNKQDEAFEKLREAEQRATMVVDIKNTLRIQELKGKFSYLLGNYVEAEKILSETLEQANDTHNIELTSTIWQNIGLVYQAQGEITKAVEIYEEAIEKLDKVGYKYKAAGIKNNLGNVLEQQGEIDRALGLYLEISNYYESIKDELSIASSNGNIGNIFYRKGIYSEAKKYYLRCLTSFEKLEYIDGILRTLHNVAGVIYLEGNVDESKKYFLQSIKKAKDFNQPVLAEQFSLSYANVLFQQQEFDSAISYYKSIEQGARSRDDSYMLSIALYSLGLAYTKISQNDKAIITLEEAIKTMESLNTTLDIYPEAINQLEKLKQK